MAVSNVPIDTTMNVPETTKPSYKALKFHLFFKPERKHSTWSRETTRLFKFRLFFKPEGKHSTWRRETSVVSKGNILWRLVLIKKRKSALKPSEAEHHGRKARAFDVLMISWL